MEPDKKTLERIVKAAVNWNGQKLEFNNKFLELQDNYELIKVPSADGSGFKLITRFK